MLDRSLVAVTNVLATTSGVMFCVKDRDGRYLAVNQAFADRTGRASPAELIGRTVYDVYPRELADRYEAQDRALLASGRTLSNELDLILRPDGSVGWFLTSKSRWTDDKGEPLGLVATTVDLKAPLDSAAPYPKLALAVEVARGRFAEQVSVAELAAAAGMTTAQLDRSCRKVLGLSPKQLLMRFRIEEALRLLQSTTMSIAEIAPACGYYDQSAFTRHFRRVVGYTPAGWRAAISGS